jgi:hypothetical protein
MLTETADGHGDRKSVHILGLFLLGVRAQEWSQKSSTTTETEKSVYILGVQKSRRSSTFLAGTSNALPYYSPVSLRSACGSLCPSPDADALQ